jgi:hypothetical protein
MRDLQVYEGEWNQSFQFQFIEEKDLTKRERDIFGNTGESSKLVGGKPRGVREVLISSTMRI